MSLRVKYLYFVRSVKNLIKKFTFYIMMLDRFKSEQGAVVVKQLKMVIYRTVFVCMVTKAFHLEVVPDLSILRLS